MVLTRKNVEEKQEEKNPNTGRKSNGPKPLSNREFMIMFGDENPDHAIATDSRDIINDLPISTECTVSQITMTKSSTMESTSSETINTVSEDLMEVDELTTVYKLLEEQNSEEIANSQSSSNQLFDTSSDDVEEADMSIPEEDERASKDKNSLLEEYFCKIQDDI